MSRVTVSRILAAFGLIALTACEVHVGSGEPAQAPTNPSPGAAPAPAPAPAPAAGAAPAPTPTRQVRVVNLDVGGGKTVPITPLNGINPFGSGTTTGGDFEGRVFFIPDGAKAMPDVTGQWPKTVLYTKQINVAPRPFTEGFPGVANQTSNFAIRYEGNFVTSVEGTYQLRILASDGALVYVDTEKLIDIDGVHPPQEGKATKKLGAGEHRFRVDYFKASKDNVALQVWLTPPGGKEALLTSE
jgi:hypothetical protein